MSAGDDSAGGPEAKAGPRRLCALVAIDIVGYSARTEADEAAAIGAVAALAAQIAGAAAAEDGRVFNTAGDGFMLEFPTVSGALAAAHAIVDASPTPVRVGLHLGEVSVTPGGDLLGHGVNVVARLQALANPGEIIVSNDARRAARGPLAERLTPVGRVRLAKMKDAGEVFSLSPDGGARRRGLRRKRWLAIAAAIGIVLLLAGLLVWRIAVAPKPTDALTVAVRSFKSNGPGAPDAAFGDALADDLTSALSDHHIPVVSRDQVAKGDLGDARLVISGDVARDGPSLRVRVQVDDARAGRALWSQSYERPAGETVALQDQTAANVADVVGNIPNLWPRANNARSEVLAALLDASEADRLNRGASEAQREAFRRLAALAPDSAIIHARYSRVIINSIAYSTAPPAEIARLHALGVAEAEKAVALDPHDASTYGALLNTLPRDDFLAKDALLTKALADNPSSTNLLSAQNNMTGDLGFMARSVTETEQAFPLGPPAPTRVTAVAFRLAGAGRYVDAKAMVERYLRLNPTSNSLRRARLLTALLYAPPKDAAEAIDAYQAQEPRLAPEAEKAWRAFVAARAGKLPPASAAKLLAAAPRGEYGVDPSTLVSAYASIGQLDDAFAEVEKAIHGHYEFYPSNLFELAAANMRRDPRFMPLAARMGMAKYWVKTGVWPDFCRDPDLPYDCKAAATAAVAGKS